VACKLSFFIAAVYVTGGHCESFILGRRPHANMLLVAAILLLFYTYSPLLRLSCSNRLLSRSANHRDFVQKLAPRIMFLPTQSHLPFCPVLPRYRYTLLESFLVSSLDLPIPYAIVCLNLSYPILRIHPVFVLDIIIVEYAFTPNVYCSGAVLLWR
jgi:hypothetical protein